MMTEKNLDKTPCLASLDSPLTGGTSWTAIGHPYTGEPFRAYYFITPFLSNLVTIRKFTNFCPKTCRDHFFSAGKCGMMYEYNCDQYAVFTA